MKQRTIDAQVNTIDSLLAANNYSYEELQAELRETDAAPAAAHIHEVIAMNRDSRQSLLEARRIWTDEIYANDEGL